MCSTQNLCHRMRWQVRAPDPLLDPPREPARKPLPNSSCLGSFCWWNLAWPGPRAGSLSLPLPWDAVAIANPPRRRRATPLQTLPLSPLLSAGDHGCPTLWTPTAGCVHLLRHGHRRADQGDGRGRARRARRGGRPRLGLPARRDVLPGGEPRRPGATRRQGHYRRLRERGDGACRGAPWGGGGQDSQGVCRTCECRGRRSVGGRGRHWTGF